MEFTNIIIAKLKHDQNPIYFESVLMYYYASEI